VKRDFRALSFELWNSIRKCHPKWDWLYLCTVNVKHTLSCARPSKMGAFFFLWTLGSTVSDVTADFGGPGESTGTPYLKLCGKLQQFSTKGYQGERNRCDTKRIL
jgi:hypothetical protein